MLGFVENIGHEYDFQGGGGGPDPKKKIFNRLLIHISNVDG